MAEEKNSVTTVSKIVEEKFKEEVKEEVKEDTIENGNEAVAKKEK